MYGKIAIFGFICALLIGISCNLSSFVFAIDEIITDCSYTKDKKTAFCSTSDSEDVWRCDKQENGTWKCDKLKARASSVPPGLQDAITNAEIGDTTNNTKGKLNIKNLSSLTDLDKGPLITPEESQKNNTMQ